MKTWEGKPYLALLADKEEDRFTEYLCQLLKSPEVLREFLTKVCKLTEVTDFSSLTVQTQVTVLGGRPDLAIRDDSTYLLFEAKVSSGLHEDQLLPYVEDLLKWKETHPHSIARLFLLGPLRDSHGLMENGTSQLEPEKLASIELASITWEEIASLFVGLEASISDARLSLHLLEFRKLINRRLGESERPYTTEELRFFDDSLAAKALVRTRLLIDRLKNMLLGDDDLEFSVTSSRGLGYDGYWLRTTERSWWFGLWLDVWADVGVSPLFFQLNGLSGKMVPSLPSDLPQPVSYHAPTSEGYVVPLRIRPQVSLDQLAREYTEIILRYCRDFPETGALST